MSHNIDRASDHWGNEQSGDVSKNATKKDMWHNEGPGSDVIDDIYYSTNYYTDTAIGLLQNRNKSKPFWLHLTSVPRLLYCLTVQGFIVPHFRYQAMHAPIEDPPVWEMLSSAVPFRDETYGSMMKVLDDGFGNLTQAVMEESGLWDNLFIIVTCECCHLVCEIYEGIVSSRHLCS